MFIMREREKKTRKKKKKESLSELNNVYAGTVITSFYYASTPTRDNCFQTNQPEHESDDRAGDTVTSVCVTNEKDIAL